MKMQLKLMLLLLGASFIIFMGCKKHDGLGTNITTTYTSAVPTEFGSIHSGTYIATGGITGTGAAVMDVHLTDDSTFCTVVLTSTNGSIITIKEQCSRDMMNPTGGWHVSDGTGLYALLKGIGTLKMTFPTSNPPEFTVIEDYTGIVWLNL